MVRGGGFSDGICNQGIKEVDLKIGKKNLFHVVGRGVNIVFSGQGVHQTHLGTRNVVPFQVIVLEEHLLVSLSLGEALGFFEVGQVLVIRKDHDGMGGSGEVLMPFG